ncbi:MAG: hypothetical protein V4461_06460 [Pseudomonadota bacterium]
MSDVEHALSQLAEIRTQMAASARFRGLAPQAIAGTGILAFVAAFLQTALPAQFPGEPVSYTLFWAAVGAIAASAIAIEAFGRAHRLHGGMAERMMGSTLRLFVPFGAVGGLLTLVVLLTAPEVCWLLPGLWQMLIALLGFAAAVTNLPRVVAWGAAWYLLCATAVLMLAGLDHMATPWMMGVPFGIAQILMAGLLHRASGDL